MDSMEYDNILTHIKRLSNSYNLFRGLFNKFQKHLHERINNPKKRIFGNETRFEIVDEKHCLLSFLDRQYIIQFSMDYLGGDLKSTGKMEFKSIVEENYYRPNAERACGSPTRTIDTVYFNEQGQLSLQQESKDSIIHINIENECIMLIAFWLARDNGYLSSSG